MNHETRKALYQTISEKRQRPLISYVTSFRNNAAASIASDVIPEFIKQVQAIESGQNEIDLLIISYGGDPTVAYRIISILRERFKKIGVLLPYTAYSAATLISLGADESLCIHFQTLDLLIPS